MQDNNKRYNRLKERIVETKVTCPSCGREATGTFSTYHIPKFGDALLTSITCEHCGYKSSDVIIPTENNPKVYELTVDTAEKLNYRVIKSSHANIEIPELGIRIDSTGFSDGYITNIEGVLLRIEDTIRELVVNKDNKKKLDELFDKIEMARSGRLRFRIIIEDPTGNSAIIRNDKKSD